MSTPDSRLSRLTTLLLFAAVVATAPLRAEGDAADARPPNVRPDDARLRARLRDGLRSSRTLRALVDRLSHSDVVVYLRYEAQRSGATVDGRLNFVSAAGGYRYLLVRLAPFLSREREIALIAHELQHAVEIAERPDIVDAASLARAFAVLGYQNDAAAIGGVAYDSDAAVSRGVQVLREMLEGNAD